MEKPGHKTETDTALLQRLKEQLAEWYDYNSVLGLQPGKVKDVPLKNTMQSHIDTLGPYDIGATHSFSRVVIEKLSNGDFTIFATPKGSDKIYEISMTLAEMNKSGSADIFASRSATNAMLPRTGITSPPLTYIESTDQLIYLIMEARKHRSPNAPNMIIDIGHLGNGNDVGASAHGLNEPTVNIPIAAAAMQKAIAEGVNVYFTAEDFSGKDILNQSFKEALLTPKTRNVLVENFAKEHPLQKTVAVSLHANSTTSHDVKGTEVFFDSGDAKSALLAKMTMHNLSASYPPHSGSGGETGVYSTDFRTRAKAFLCGPNSCPKIMTEIGYISNAEQAAMLQKPGSADLCGEHIFEAAAYSLDILTQKHIDTTLATAQKNIDNFRKNLNSGNFGPIPAASPTNSLDPLLLQKKDGRQAAK